MTVRGVDRHIESTPDIAGGKPRVTGRRITVQDIAIWHQRLGKSVDEICTEHDLSHAEVHAALAHYFDNREQIDRGIDEADAFAEALRASTPSILEKKLGDRRGD